MVKDRTEGNPALCCSKRQELALLTFVGVMLLYGFRVTMSVSMVCMTSVEQNSQNDDAIEDNDTSSASSENNNTNISPEPEFDWDKTTQGVILGSFFWAYFLTPIPGGWIAEKIGGKRLFGTSVFLCSALTLLTPFAAETHLAFLIVVRVLCGLAQGLMWPAQQMVWARWAPPLERTILSGFSVSGLSLGNVVAFPVSGILCTYGFGSGWPSIFYVFGGVGVLWCLTWTILVYDSPADHPRISLEEKAYILKSLHTEIDVSFKPKKIPWIKIFKSPPVWSIVVIITCTDWAYYTFLTNIPTYLKEIYNYNVLEPKKIPWIKIFKSPPVWSIVVIITCTDWAYYTFLTNIPTYLKEIYNYNVLEGGFLSAMPFLGHYIIMIISIPTADFLRRRGYMTTTAVRKMFHTLGSFLPGILLILTSQLNRSPKVAVGLLMLGISISGFVFGAVTSSNALDIASRYSGIIMGIATSIGTISGILAPIVIGVLTTDGTRDQWQIVFYIVATIYISGGVFYLIFGSGEVQEWARDETDNATLQSSETINQDAESMKTVTTVAV